MSTREDDLEDAIGSDSFLDIASNIVGVLIILVLVGATARGVVIAQLPNTFTTTCP